MPPYSGILLVASFGARDQVPFCFPLSQEDTALSAKVGDHIVSLGGHIVSLPCSEKDRMPFTRSQMSFRGDSGIGERFCTGAFPGTQKTQNENKRLFGGA